MNRKELKVGMRVVPSGRGFTKYWNLSRYIGTVQDVGSLYVRVKWDEFEEMSNLKPVHLSVAINPLTDSQ